jgi:hypothetical protein
MPAKGRANGTSNWPRTSPSLFFSTTSEALAAMNTIRSSLTNMLSRITRKTIPPRMIRKPMAIAVGEITSSPVRSASIASKIFDCVAMEVSPEATRAKPNVKLNTGMPKARSVT